MSGGGEMMGEEEADRILEGKVTDERLQEITWKLEWTMCCSIVGVYISAMKIDVGSYWYVSDLVVCALDSEYTLIASIHPLYN